MGIVDCHFHVIAPLAQAPMVPTRSYTPMPASLPEWRATLATRGVTHGVVVQPSVYGTDNRVLLAALAQGGGKLVGVAAVPPEVQDDELDRLAAAGVRGVRMAHFEADDPLAMGGFVPFAAFDALERRLADRGLHLQLLTDSRLLPSIADRLLRSRVAIVIDHMGRAPARLGTAHPGIAALSRLMRDGPVWVKLSGIANISDAAPAHEDARAVHEALMAAAPDRLMWGSDWPHTRPRGPRPTTSHLMDLFQAWTPMPLRDRLLSQNATAFYRL
ncbi:MAG: amidohydrolase family protein [Burkholderiaceae bacterium]|nr:amidohydrolase family protein [Burkholderiaceae bacterium]